MSVSDSCFERRHEEERELDRKAMPVQTAVDEMNASNHPVTAAELMALCERVDPLYFYIYTDIALDRVAPRMAPSETTALFALAAQPANRRALRRALHHCDGSQREMARAILPSWSELDAGQQEAVKPFTSPFHVLDVWVNELPKLTWKQVDEIGNILFLDL